MKQKIVRVKQIRRQLWNSMSPDDYDEHGEPYLRKGMNQRQLNIGRARKKRDQEEGKFDV